MLHRYLIVALMASLLPVSTAHASADMDCDAIATLRQITQACAGVPILSPGNDTRLNAMLLMADGGAFAQSLPDPNSIPIADRASRLIVPFSYYFSGWIDIGQRQASDADDLSTQNVQSDVYADGEGNLCRSMASGERLFNGALDAAKDLLGDDAARLRTARVDVAKACGTPAGSVWTAPAGLKSALSQQFATYLDGASAFYRHDFVSATKAFANASHSTDPWLKETALYMTGRAQLNEAQPGAFDADSSTPDRAGVKKVSLDAADAVFRAYLRIYPHGRYAASAAGLERRIAWLSGNATRQADLYDNAFARWSPKTSNVSLEQLANELDSKLLLTSNLDSSQVQSSSVLAILDLMRMRGRDYDDSTERKRLTLNELQAQKPRFASVPALHDYLVATYHVYVDHKPEQALALLPQSFGASLDYVGLSQQTLRGFALEDSGQTDKARQLWINLIPVAKHRLQRESLELALAINLEQAGLVDRVFADESPVRNAGIRAILLQRAANAKLLRAQAQNKANSGELRDIALFTLLYKELTRANYAEFISDLAMFSDTPSGSLKTFALPGYTNDERYTCPSASDIAATLQKRPDDAKGLNCLAEFVRRNPPAYGLYELPAVMEESARKNPADFAKVSPTLGSAASQFPGKPYQRIAGYRAVISNTQAPADDRAYALYRAINCFAPGGYSECGGNDISIGTRKQWFTTLKSAYPRSQWAQSQRYYW